jgi:hypothetical protein
VGFGVFYHRTYRQSRGKTMRKCLDCDKDLVDAKGPKKRCDNCNIEYRKLYWRIRENQTERKKKNIERRKKFAQKNPDKIKEYGKKYRNKNRSKVLESRRKWYAKSYNNNLQYKLGNLLRYRLWKALKDQDLKKDQSTIELLGCSKEELITHLESQFQTGMSWGNWSLNGWHIDHIRPVSSFDLSDPAQVKECFHFSNLQPLWAVDNIKKSNSWDIDPQDTIFF